MKYTVPGNSEITRKLLGLCQAEEIDRVAAHHLVLLVRRHAGEIFFNNAYGIRPVGFLVRKIGAPDEAIHVHFVAQLDPDPIELKAPEAMLADVFAWRAAQRLKSQKALGPPVMAGLTPLRPPPEGKEPAQFGF